MPGERIGNSNQYLTISGVVSAPAYSWASDNDTGLYRIGANNIGIAASGTKVLDISNTAVTITPATTLSAALTYGGVTLSNAVTGTGNMVLSASPTLSGTLTAATVTTTGNVQIGDGVADSFSVGCASPTTGDNQQSFIHKGLTFFSGTGATPAGVIGNNFYQNGNLLYRQTGFASYINFSSVDGHIGLNFAASGLADASASFTEKVTFATSGATTFASTIASGAITSTGAVTGTYFTPTATGNNGLGLAAANTPAFYASTTEVMRSTTALITAVKPIKANALYKDTTSVSVPTSTATTIITSIPYTDGLMLVETHQGTTTGGACIIACQSNPVIVAQWSTYATHTFSISGQALQLTTNLGTATYTTTYTYLGTKNA